MRITERRLRKLVRSVIEEISLPTTKPEELRDTYRYNDLDNVNNWERNPEESMRNTYPDLYREEEDEEVEEFDYDYDDNPIYDEFPEEEIDHN